MNNSVTTNASQLTPNTLNRLFLNQERRQAVIGNTFVTKQQLMVLYQ